MTTTEIIGLIVGILSIVGAYAGVFITWGRMREKIGMNEKTIAEMKNLQAICSREQTQRFQKILEVISEFKETTAQRIGEVSSATKVIEQRVTDVLTLQRQNGGRGNA